MNWKKSAPWLIALTADLVILDSVLKYFALRQLPEEGSLLHPGIFALAIHRNPGIAFDLEFSMPIIIILSIIIGGILAYIGIKNFKDRPKVSVFAFAVVLGATGNLLDRIIHGFTVDYIVILGRSVINLADLVIVAGVIGLLVSMKQKPRDPEIHR